MQQISDQILKVRKLLINSVKNTSRFQSNFGDWCNELQNNDYESSVMNQFLLESILANSMKLSLFDDQLISTMSLSELFDIGKEKISLMIFENDYYSWLNEIDNKVIEIEFKHLSNILKSKDFTIFNKLYETFFCKNSRKSKGEFYTEMDIANFIIRITKIPKSNEIIVLDPACGAGSFIIALLDYWHKTAKDKNWKILGVDINYFACLMARIAYYKWYNKNFSIEKIDFIPIFWMDYLIDYNESLFIDDDSKKNRIVNINSTLEDTARNYLKDIFSCGLDMITGNPPYLRIKKIPVKQRKKHREKFKSASGSYDIYTLFIEHSLNLVKNDGLISFICSNKFLTTNYGKEIRTIIKDNASIERIIDFTDTNLFNAQAMTLIAIFSKSNENHKFNYTILTKTKEQTQSLISRKAFWEFLVNTEEKNDEIIKIVNFNGNKNSRNNAFNDLKIAISSFKKDQPINDQSWHFLPEHLDFICTKMDLKSNSILDEIAKINVGIKTTCDEVFIFQDTPVELERSKEFIRPIVSGKYVEKWSIKKEIQDYILYPYVTEENGKSIIEIDDHPGIKKYFEKHKEKLQARKYIMESPNVKWYEIWVPLTPNIFEVKRKIITADISPGNKFALDTNRLFCNGTCYTITPINLDEDFTYYLLGLLNSELYEFYHKAKFASSLYSKRWRYMYKQLSLYPILKLDNSSNPLYNKIINIVKSLITENKEIVVDALEKKLNQNIFQLYNVTNQEISQIRKYLRINS